MTLGNMREQGVLCWRRQGRKSDVRWSSNPACGHRNAWQRGPWWRGRSNRQKAYRDMALRDRAELTGKNLACWCRSGAPCHADVLLRFAADGIK
jgi:hypothetical protein